MDQKEPLFTGNSNAVDMSQSNSHNTSASHNTTNSNNVTQTHNVTDNSTTVHNGLSVDDIIKLQKAMSEQQKASLQQETLRLEQEKLRLEKERLELQKKQSEASAFNTNLSQVTPIAGSEKYQDKSVLSQGCLFWVIGLAALVFAWWGIGEIVDAIKSKPSQKIETVIVTEPAKTQEEPVKQPVAKRNTSTQTKSSQSAPKPSVSTTTSSTKSQQSAATTPVIETPAPVREHPFAKDKQAADGGDLGAMYRTAHCYQQGDGVGKDLSQAFYYMKKAAEGGYTAAYRELGDMYHGGRGVTKDRNAAALWYQKAVNNGDAKAQRILDNLL